MTLQLMDELITIESCSTQCWKRTLKLLIYFHTNQSKQQAGQQITMSAGDFKCKL